MEMFYFDKQTEDGIEEIREMNDYGDSVKGNLSKIVHPNYIDDFIKVLAFAYHEQYEAGITLASDLDLGQKEFAAFEEDLDKYNNALMKEDYERTWWEIDED